MQDFIPIKADINGKIGAVTVKQYDNNSRFLHVTISDMDLSDGDSKAFIMQDCSAALYIQPEGSDDPAAVNYVAGEIADAENGVVTFLIPGSVTQESGRYKCEIWIYGSNEETHPIISTRPFLLLVEKSIRNDSAIEASSQFSALDEALSEVAGIRSGISSVNTRMDDLPQFRSGINDSDSDYNGHVYEYTIDGTFYADPVNQGWTDLPTSDAPYAVTNAKFANDWILQTAVNVNSPGDMYNRIIPASGTTGTYAWHKVGGSV